MLVCIRSPSSFFASSFCCFPLLFPCETVEEAEEEKKEEEEEEERNISLQAAYIIGTFFFCHEARELVKISFSSFSLPFGPWQLFLKKAIVT
jgi:hypothetical protein